MAKNNIEEQCGDTIIETELKELEFIHNIIIILKKEDFSPSNFLPSFSHESICPFTHYIRVMSDFIKS